MLVNLIVKNRKLDETLYIQVAYELPNNKHETDNLLNIKDNYKKSLLLVNFMKQLK